VASFLEFSQVCQSLGQTSSRLQIAALAGEFLAALEPREAEIAARFMVGKALEQGGKKRLQVSGRAIWRIAADVADGHERGEGIFAEATDFGEAIEILLRTRAINPPATLTLAEVDEQLREIASIEGRNSRARKLAILRQLLNRATALEGKYLAKILIGEMRHGMSDGLMLEAIARMASRPIAEVRRAHMMEPDLGRLVARLRAGELTQSTSPDSETKSNEESAAAISATCDHSARVTPLRPMLAAPATTIAEAFRILEGNFALEHKLDGARVQIHCAAGDVRIFSRRMNEITPSLPEIVEMMRPFEDRHAIFDGEVIAVDRSGRVIAFQELMRRFGRLRNIEKMRVEQPVRLFVFDLIGIDRSLLIDLPYYDRYGKLRELAEDKGMQLATRLVPESLKEAELFYAQAITDGYEGVMAKSLDSLYTPGVRGRGWLKIKHAKTLDLVIVGADWGYGRRHGWLSNYHLAARDSRNGGFVEVGKTFKGMTDEDFGEMTERLQKLKVDESRGTVHVRPEVVVEVAYSDIQRSPQYAGGMALRFARIVGVRSDKSAEEADTIDAVTAAFDRQLVKPLAARD
jgi:DNA ligase-1